VPQAGRRTKIVSVAIAGKTVDFLKGGGAVADIDLFEDLDAAARAAAGALDRAAQPSLFDRLDWFRLLAGHCPPPGKPLAVRARDGGRSAWLFLAVRHPVAEAFANFYSLRFDAIGRRDEDLLTAIAAALRDGGLAEVDLAPLEDPAPLAAAFRNAGWIPSVTPFAVNWRVDTAGKDFEAYWSERPGQLRNTAKRRAKAANLEVAIHDRFDEAAWADYEAVYRASWKPEEGSFPFLRALAEAEGAAGTLRLGIARSDGAPVAAQLWLVENGEAVIHKLAYAESAKELSPGTILSMAMFRHVLDRDRVERIDYGNGDEPYKADWMAERRTLWQLRAFNPRTMKGLFRAGKARLGALAARGGSR
jgi:CelD/BcsL family acetyltransferase involved in cellulose biosynthesis